MTTSVGGALCQPAPTRNAGGTYSAQSSSSLTGGPGRRLYTEQHREEILYDARQNTPALSSYFELMDRLLPSFLGTLSNESIRGTRILLR